MAGKKAERSVGRCALSLRNRPAFDCHTNPKASRYHSEWICGIGMLWSFLASSRREYSLLLLAEAYSCGISSEFSAVARQE
jgi:hypothetical protein